VKKQSHGQLEEEEEEEDEENEEEEGLVCM
jgi:hypothetical protein